jgi:hypothetical protein
VDQVTAGMGWGSCRVVAIPGGWTVLLTFVEWFQACQRAVGG